MKTIITEKKIAAASIAGALGISTLESDGCFKGDDYWITWAEGHLFEACEPEYYKDEWKTWSLETLPIMPDMLCSRLIPKKAKRFKVIKDVLKKSDLVINAGDCGQEGEYIIALILEHAGYKGEVKRLWVESLEESEIKRGMKNLKPADDYRYLEMSARLRQYVDWVFGLTMTRAFTLKQGKSGEGAINTGRVTTPTLNAIVERYLENKAFKVETYQVITFEHQGLKYSSDRLEKPEETAKRAKTFRVDEAKEEDKKEPPKKLFSLDTLQIEANRHYGFTSAKTLNLAQALYEKGFISYPRTGSQSLPENYSCQEIEQIFKNNSEDLSVDPKNRRIFNSKDVEDHHALILTQKVPQAFENEDQQKIYEMIRRRFLAAFYPDCEKKHFSVKGTIEGTDTQCKAKRTVITKKGYKEMYTFKEKEEKEEDDPTDQPVALPEEGEQFAIEPVLEERKTKPPRLYTEAELIAFMKNAGKSINETLKNGIGTVATRAEIIDKLRRGQFFEEKKGKFIPTEKGIRIIESIPMEAIKKPYLTVKLESYFDEIKNGVDPSELKQRFQKGFLKQVKAVRQMQQAEGQKSSPYPCPKCGNPLFISKFGLFCKEKNDQGKPHMSVPFIWFDQRLKKEDLDQLFAFNKTRLIQGFKKGEEEPFAARLYLDKDNDYKLTFGFEKKPEITEICPKCKQDTLKFGKYGIYCDSKCKGEKRFSLQKTIASTEIETEDLIRLLKGQTSQKTYRFLSSKGNPFKAKISLKDDFSVEFIFEGKTRGASKKR